MKRRTDCLHGASKIFVFDTPSTLHPLNPCGFLFDKGAHHTTLPSSIKFASLLGYATDTPCSCQNQGENSMEKTVLQAILENHLLLFILILFALFVVPALLLRGRGLRNSHGVDRRQKPRSGIDRRA